jgi:hypothetical protein
MGQYHQDLVLYQISIIITYFMGRSGPPGRRGARRDVEPNVHVQGASAATPSGGPLLASERETAVK